MTHLENAKQAAAALVVLAALILAGMAPPFVVVALSARSVAPISPAEALVGTIAIPATNQWGDPRRAYPPSARSRMPAEIGWWFALFVPLGVVGVSLLAMARPLDVATARRRLGRRWYDLRGLWPRAWARPRDVRSLVVSARSGERMTLGRLDGRLLATDHEAMVALCAPIGAGKTTRYVIPWLLEHEGPALVSGTKRDIEQATVRQRSRHGQAWTFDPFSQDSCCWDPLEGCIDWGRALRQSKWLADAASDPQHSHIAEFWGAEAAKLLAPLMHAAALANKPISQVIAWLDTQEQKQPMQILRTDGDERAALQLAGIYGLDGRNRGTTIMSASNLLAAYRFPEVAATARPGFSASDLLNGSAGTLYITATSRHQRLVAPVIVALISSVVEAAVEKARSHGGALHSPLRMLLDEAANTAPLKDLPSHLAQLRSHNVRIATVWQSLAQIKERYGDGANTILASSTCKIFMGPITDAETLSYVAQLLGDVPIALDRGSTLGPKAPAADLQQLGRNRALTVAGAMAPAIVHVKPWWEIPEFSAQDASAL